MNVDHLPLKMTIRLPGLNKTKAKNLLDFSVPYDSIKLRFRSSLSPTGVLPDIRASLVAANALR